MKVLGTRDRLCTRCVIRLPWTPARLVPRRSDVRTQLPNLSVYMGHLGMLETYHYLSATPELLTIAGEMFDRYAEAGGHVMSDNALDSSPLGPLLQSFFTDHMLSHRRASRQTVDSYRDTFRLLLRFLQQSTGKEPASLRVGDLDAPAILSFLDHIEQQRKNQIQSRNVRLAAIRSFFRLVALRDPASVQFVTRVLAIPLKRADKRLVGYLTRRGDGRDPRRSRPQDLGRATRLHACCSLSTTAAPVFPSSLP